MKGNRQSCIGRRLTTAVLLAAGNAQLSQNENQYQAVFSDSSGSTITAAATLAVFDYTFTVGQIAVDLTLSGGATPATPSNDFFNMPNNHPEP